MNWLIALISMALLLVFYLITYLHRKAIYKGYVKRQGVNVEYEKFD